MSDDDDLLTSYDVAKKELNGNLKFQVTIMPSEVKPAEAGETEKKEKKEKAAATAEKIKKKAVKTAKEAKKKGKKASDEVDTLERA